MMWRRLMRRKRVSIRREGKEEDRDNEDGYDDEEEEREDAGENDVPVIKSILVLFACGCVELWLASSTTIPPHSVSVCHFLSLYLCLPICLSLSFSGFAFLCLSICLSFSLSFYRQRLMFVLLFHCTTGGQQL